MADQTLKTSPDDLLPQVDDATARLLATVERLDNDELRRPSLLPGWSRAHVLTHLSRGADSRVRLLVAARTRTPLRQYRDERSREQEIEQGATRTRDEILADLRTSAERLATAIAEHPPQRWGRKVCWLGEEERPVADVVSSRLQELEIHHVDLAAGYGYQDWPQWFAADELARAVDEMRGRPEFADVMLHAMNTDMEYRFGDQATRTVRGGLNALLAWLIGRTSGEGLVIEPPGELPHPPTWK
jgi:maleylpyruvate isomerase